METIKTAAPAAPHPAAAAFRAALPVSMPVMAGYLFLGTGYGILMNKLGYGPGWTVLMSVLVLGGSIQYIATSLLASGFQPLYAFVISLMVNARHLFYGFSMLGPYANTGWKKPFLAFWLTDETFSLVCSGEVPEGVDADWYRFFVSGLDYLYWVAGSLVGSVAGYLLTFNTAGIDFVMTALFTVIVVNQWKSTHSHLPALIGAAASLACLVVFGPEYFIIPSMIVIVAALMAGRSRIEPAIVDEEAGDCR